LNQSSQPSSSFTIYALSEQAVTISFGNKIDVQLLRAIKNYEEQLTIAPFPGFITSVIAYTSLTVHYNIERVANSHLPGQSCFDKVSGYLQSLESSDVLQEEAKQEPIRVPVCYGSVQGPDLSDLAKEKDMDELSFIELHSSAVYTVYMIGFVPGFAYLGGMDPLLSAPRKNKPRAEVPVGSVGIAGLQTGIYPLTTPGGWQLIGQTPLRLFDPSRAQPSLFQAGDLLKFYQISVEQFITLSNS
jgi:inhibitor of KinA